MGHDHHHNSIRNIKIAFFLNLGFTIFEIFGGFYTNSVAILSDAIHDLGDSLSLGLAWFLEKRSAKKSDKHYSFGYQRFSVLGALINSIVLIGGSIYILSITIPRLNDPQQANAEGMIFFAIIGILVNGAAVLRLKKGNSLNERIVSIHLLEDVLGWVAVLIVSVILLFWDVPILDPLLSILILGYVLFNVFKNLIKTLRVFLQRVPDDIDLGQLEKEIGQTPKVRSVHHTHVWSLNGTDHVLSIHIVIAEVNSISEIIEIKKRTKNILRSNHIEHATIEIEFEDESCYMEEHDHRSH